MPELICALGPDNAGTVLADRIRGARFSLDIAMYEIGPSYAWALAAAARRGVRVRVVLDGHRGDGNAETVETVAAAGGQCRVLDRTTAAGHWKLLLIDGTEVAVGTGNLIWRDAPRRPRGRVASPPSAPLLRGTREWWSVTDDTDVALSAGVAIEAAWEAAVRPPRAWSTGRHAREDRGAVGVPSPQVEPLHLASGAGLVRLVVGGLAVAASLRDAMCAAQTAVMITAPYIASRAASVRALVSEARAVQSRGVEVRVLLGAMPHPREAGYLARAGIPVRWMDPSASTRGHAKGLIADGTAVVTSANWSRAGFGANWEAALVMNSAAAAAYLAAAWERDWATAQPVAALV